MEILCPHCALEQKGKPEKEWKYGADIHVQRFKCKCKKLFNFYTNGRKFWTIPKKMT
jgi:hypothetical protein